MYILDVREHLYGDGQFGFDVAVISVRYGARVLVVLVEGPAPQVMDAESEHGHLEKILFRNGDLTLALAVAVAAGESVTFIKKFMPRSPTKPNTRKLVRLAIL